MPAYFLFHLIKNLATTTGYKRHGTDLVNRQVLIPGEDLQMMFSRAFSVNHAMCEKLIKAIRVLTNTRNCVFPWLMFGKLSVQELDIQFPPSMANTEPVDS